MRSRTRIRHRQLVYGLAAVICALVLPWAQAGAQEAAQVQELRGEIQPGKLAIYQIPKLTAGQTLYVYMEHTAGNLDPLVALLEGDVDLVDLLADYDAAVQQAIESGEDPVAAVELLRQQYALALDDDSGQGYDAAMSFSVPADGDYILLASHALTTLGLEAYGRYRLLLGIDAPQVLAGQAIPTGETIAVLDADASQSGTAVQETKGTLTAEKRSTFFYLTDVRAGDTFYAYAEATSGDLAPILILQDFGQKPLAAGNLPGRDKQATLQYTFPEDGEGFSIALEACCGPERLTAGDFRLLVGINAPEVLTGEADPVGNPILQLPKVVSIGVKLQQITGVDQQAENFGAVASLGFRWQDADLAFNPDTCNCSFKVYQGSKVDAFIAEVDGQWPDFTLFNQQGNRWTQNRVVIVFPDGRAQYFERFSTTFQAPDFNFRHFPFDVQEFFIRTDNLYPREFYNYSAASDLNEVGSQLGEEEWYVADWGTTITAEEGSISNNVISRFSFRMEMRRHLVFYIFRIFVPLGLIILVAWITFFLKDYGKRIEATTANLLLFIAFNFTVGGEIPRLGYLTFLDTLLMATFVISVLVVAYNVALKRLEVTGKEARAKRIDNFAIWLYPVVYALAFGILAALFFVYDVSWLGGPA